MKKKGFTLIELLAVIVILAIIALIITPIVSDIIKSSSKAAAMRSVEGYISAANNAAAVSLIDTNGITVTKDKYSFEAGEDDSELSKIDISGKKPSYVYLEYDVELQAVVLGNFCYNGYAFDYDNGKITDGAIDYCSTSFVDRPRVIISAPNKLNSKVIMSIEFSENTVSGKYKIGTGEYIDYTEPFEIESSKELANQRDEHGNLKVCVKAILNSGETEICRNLIKLDLDYPADPVILATAGYPTLTSAGVSNGTLSVAFDTNSGITNYISFNGTDWNLYTGSEQLVGNKVYAKSVKNESGLENVAIVDVNSTPAADAITSEAYDGDLETAMIYHAGYNNVATGMGETRQYRYMYIDESMRGERISIKWYCWNWNGYAGHIAFVDASENVVGTEYTISGGKTETIMVSIPSTAVKMRYHSYPISSSSYSINGKLYEIIINYSPEININSYPTLTSSGVETRSDVTISYPKAAATRLYRINEGEWQEYNSSTSFGNLTFGTKLEAKGIDANGRESSVSTITVQPPTDAITSEAYDGDLETAMIYHAGYNGVVSANLEDPKQYRSIAIDASARGKHASVKWYSWNWNGYVSYIDFVDESGNSVGTTYSLSGGKTETITIDIPSNAFKMRYYMSIVSSSSYSINSKLYEITLID